MNRIMATCFASVLCLSVTSNEVFCSQRAYDSPYTSSDEDSRGSSYSAVPRIDENNTQVIQISDDESDESLSVDMKSPVKRRSLENGNSADLGDKTLVTPPSTPKKRARLIVGSTSTPEKNPYSISSFFGRSGYTPIKKKQADLSHCDSPCVDISHLHWINITEERAKILAKNPHLEEIILPRTLERLDHLLDCASGKNFLAVFSSETMNNIFKPCRIVPRDHKVKEDFASAGIFNQIHAVVISSGQPSLAADEIRHSVKLPRSDKDQMNAIVCLEPKVCEEIPSWCKVIIAWFPNLESIQSKEDLLYRARRRQWREYPDACWGMLIRNSEAGAK